MVVPSLAERSCDEEASINILAVGCSTLAVSRTVTPSLVTNADPSASTSILSRPLGPSVERIAPARDEAALTLFTNAVLPCILSVSSIAKS